MQVVLRWQGEVELNALISTISNVLAAAAKSGEVRVRPQPASYVRALTARRRHGVTQGLDELKSLKGEYGQHMTKLKEILVGLEKVKPGLMRQLNWLVDSLCETPLIGVAEKVRRGRHGWPASPEERASRGHPYLCIHRDLANLCPTLEQEAREKDAQMRSALEQLRALQFDLASLSQLEGGGGP